MEEQICGNKIEKDRGEGKWEKKQREGDLILIEIKYI